jgi:nitroreductase
MSFIDYVSPRLSEAEALRVAQDSFAELDSRRSLRDFSDAPVDKTLIEWAIRTASTAPSGAHKQPWTFAAVSNPTLKRKIRLAAEEEEKAFYATRAPESWLADLHPLGTRWEKPYLETVPWLVVLFAHQHGIAADGARTKNYYVQESVGIAAGLFITALHRMGLSTLTHTPSPMGFLTELLGRPKNERPVILFPIGHAAEDAQVPNLRRKSLDEVSAWFE